MILAGSNSPQRMLSGVIQNLRGARKRAAVRGKGSRCGRSRRTKVNLLDS